MLTIIEIEALHRSVRRRGNHVTVVGREVLDIVINRHAAVPATGSTHLHPHTGVGLQNLIVRVNKGEHAVVATDLVTGLEGLTRKGLIVAQALRTTDRVVLQPIVVGITHEIIFCIGETFWAFCAEWKGNAKFSRGFFRCQQRV